MDDTTACRGTCSNGADAPESAEPASTGTELILMLIHRVNAVQSNYISRGKDGSLFHYFFMCFNFFNMEFLVY